MEMEKDGLLELYNFADELESFSKNKKNPEEFDFDVSSDSGNDQLQSSVTDSENE